MNTMADTGLATINVEQLNNAVSRIVNAASAMVPPPAVLPSVPALTVLPPPQQPTPIATAHNLAVTSNTLQQVQQGRLKKVKTDTIDLPCLHVN